MFDRVWCDSDDEKKSFVTWAVVTPSILDMSRGGSSSPENNVDELCFDLASLDKLLKPEPPEKLDGFLRSKTGWGWCWCLWWKRCCCSCWWCKNSDMWPWGSSLDTVPTSSSVRISTPVDLKLNGCCCWLGVCCCWFLRWILKKGLAFILSRKRRLLSPSMVEALVPWTPEKQKGSPLSAGLVGDQWCVVILRRFWDDNCWGCGVGALLLKTAMMKIEWISSFPLEEEN